MVSQPIRGATGEAHFLALDSLRGICALAVCLYHFRTTGVISNLPFVRHSWLFVDFFFVLSGFVIASAYGRRIAEGAVSAGRFMWLRMGRIYPLHIAVLLALIALESALVLFDVGAASHWQAFSGARPVEGIASHIFLLHAFGVHERPTWNIPSWSIAAEMWMYLLFAIVCTLFPRRWAPVLWLLGLASALCLQVVSPKGLDVTFDLGFIRCVFGFATGTLVFRLFQNWPVGGGTLVEAVAVVAVIAFVSLLPGDARGTLLAPFVFGAAIMVFATGRGGISRVMQLSPFVWLGTISYSTYMIHAFLQARIGDVVALAGRKWGIVPAAADNPAFPAETLVGEAWRLDLLTLAMLALVIVAGSVSYIVVERPFREWSRRAAAISTKPVSQTDGLSQK